MGPNGLSVSIVNSVVLCDIPGPTYWMAAAAGIMSRTEWFAGTSSKTLKVKDDVLASQTAPAQISPLSGQSCTLTGIILRFTEQFQFVLFDMILVVQLGELVYTPEAWRLKSFKCT